MQRSIRALVASLAITLPMAPLGAQVYVVNPGTIYTTGAVQSAVLGSQMNGLGVQVTFTDGSISSGSWGYLFTVGSTDFYGVQTSVFNLLFEGDRDTGGPNSSQNDFNLANVGNSGESIASILFTGAPANVVFDRTFGGLDGTPGSGPGRDVVEANDPGGNEFQMTVTYSNLVSLGGAPPVGDLFESLHIAFGNPVPEGENYSLFLDTDLARGLTAVPEPATVGLVGFGLLALGVGARRRARR